MVAAAFTTKTSWMLVLASLFLCIVKVPVSAFCPNKCSGHGTCGKENVCACFEGWQGGAADCSFRECPVGTAWFDKPYADDLAHQPVECSNAGICDYGSGLCKCFDGYTGNACQRSTCPNDCNGRGTCVSMRDISLFSGPDYDHAIAFSGDGLGPEYSNWEANSLYMCECELGYFGADCSQVMCPKNDDPLTLNQNYRRIRMSVTGDGDYGLNNDVGLQYNGMIVYLSVSASQTSTECTKSLSHKGPFGEVKCEYEEINPLQRDFYLTFLSWPLHPRENNLFENDGNPAITEFRCDTSVAPFGTRCEFTDETKDYIKEYRYCSHRGICNFANGECTCNKGYGGLSCNETTPITQSGANALPGLLVNTHGPGFHSSVLQMNSDKAPAPDFNFTDTRAAREVKFAIRGDGAMEADRLLILTGGHTIQGGGIFVEDGGMTIADHGLDVSSTMTNIKTASLKSMYSSELTDSDTVLKLSSQSYQGSHALFRATRQNVDKFYLKADGGTYISDSGMQVTGGMSIISNGISAKYNGARVESGKLYVKDDVEINGGVQIIDGGIQVARRGIKIYDGGLEAGNEQNLKGMSIVGGVSVNSGGLQLTGGMTITTSSLTVTGGVTVSDSGLFIDPVTNIGITVTDGGVTITGGISIPNSAVITGGITIPDSGIFVSNGGATINSNAILLTGGLTVFTAGLKVSAPDFWFNTFDVFDGGLVATGGLSVSEGGLVLKGGGVESEGSVTVTGGVTLRDLGLHVTAGLTILDGGGTARNLLFGDSIFHNDLILEGGSIHFDRIIGNAGASITFTTGMTVYTQNVGGKCYIDNTDYTVSDKRLKTNYAPIVDALGKVHELSGVYYDWVQNGDGPTDVYLDSNRHVGVIAQQVQEVLPEVVDTSQHGQYLAVNYKAMVPLLIEAIKDLLDKHEESMRSERGRSAGVDIDASIGIRAAEERRHPLVADTAGGVAKQYASDSWTIAIKPENWERDLLAVNRQLEAEEQYNAVLRADVRLLKSIISAF